MKTLYDIAKERARQTLNEKKKKELECLLQTRHRELKDCIYEYDDIEKIKAIKSDEIKIISYVDNGGCGNSGELFIVTQCDDGVIVFCFNCWNEESTEEFQYLLPWLCPFLDKFNALFPDNKMHEMHPRGWKHLYLGLGNHLFINDDIYPMFIDENVSYFINNHQYSKLHLYWKDRVSEILGIEI